MKILLDTHVVLWAILDSRRVPKLVAELLVDPENEAVVGPASAWEIAITQSLGKLTLPWEARWIRLGAGRMPMDERQLDGCERPVRGRGGDRP